jgi:hypothetical protein
MTKYNKALAGASVAAVAVLGLGVLAPVGVSASTYDAATNTITAELVTDPASVFDGTYGFTGDNGANFAADAASIAADGLTITGDIDDIRGALEYIYTYISGGGVGGAALKAALAGVNDLTLDVVGDAEITPNDLGYVQFLEKFAKNTSNATATVAVNVDGNITFGSGTGYYASDSIADVVDAGGASSISATGTITIPDGYGDDIAGFLGSAVVEAGSKVVSDGVTYIATADNVFEVEVVPPETGEATSVAPVLFAMLGLLASGALAVGLIRHMATRK